MTMIRMMRCLNRLIELSISIKILGWWNEKRVKKDYVMSIYFAVRMSGDIFAF